MQDTERRQGIRLEGITIGWNALEAAVAITAGLAASSAALVAFGLDSVVEVTAAVVVLWQFLGIAEERERLALKLIGASFFLLAAYVAFSSINDLVTGSEPDASTVGIVLTALSVMVMPALAWAKRRAGERINSRTLIADAHQTLLCVYLSASTLLGLVANAAFGWWWADPAAALVVAGLALNEGREAWGGGD
ncbi:MAG TPA: cation transporter [Acidimicrobiia bacterium]|nr:cation transporter [Acidimicrobiia bacterium]